VAGQATREGGAIATIADLRELEVQTEVSESNVAKLARNMPATVSVQAYRDREYRGRIRDIFPSADRAKAIVEVRVSILDADRQVKPEMTASVTFEESRPEASAVTAGTAAPGPPGVLVPKRAIATRGGKASVWIVTGERATRRTITPGPERLDQVEVEAGVAPGEAVLLNPPGDLPDQARVRVRGS
jgi:RND family efflux transporter MFP subunit